MLNSETCWLRLEIDIVEWRLGDGMPRDAEEVGGFRRRPRAATIVDLHAPICQS